MASLQATLQDEIVHAVAQLPDDQREVFLLREYHGLPFREIATIVNAKEGTVKSRMRYALESLRNELAHHADYARTLP
jgi:RNA polymerase sigma-70 factor (ECF subfamily)